MLNDKKGIRLIVLVLIIVLVVVAGVVTIIFVMNKNNSNNQNSSIIENNNGNNDASSQKIDRTVSKDFSYEHCSFWTDEEENNIFTFIGTDKIKFYSVSNSGLYNTGLISSSNSYNEERGIGVIVDGKYIVVVSSEDYRGTHWTTQKLDADKYQLSNTNGKEIYALSSGKYQLVKEVDGKKVYFYTSIDKVAKEISELEERKEKIYQILDEVSSTIVKYDNSSFAIDKVAQDEFTRFNLKVNSYKNVTYYCSDLNSNYNARIQVNDYIFKVLFKEVNENQIFNYKMSEYTVGNNSIGYYSSGSHTNLTIQNLDNNSYQNDYLIITEVSIPSSEKKSILEYAPELLNKVFSN